MPSLLRPAAASIIPSIPSFFIFSNLVPTFPLIGTIFKSLLIFLNCAALLILLVPIIAPFLKFFKEIPSLDTKTSLTSSLSGIATNSKSSANSYGTSFIE